MMPRELATEAQLKKQIKYFEDLRLTSHHSIRAKPFPKKPNAYSNAELEPILPPSQPKLTKLGRKLVEY